MKDETKIILPEEIFELSTGEKVTISPLSFADLILHSDLVVSLISKIEELKDLLKDADDKTALKVMFRGAAEEVLELMTIVLGKPREWFSTIKYSDGLGIFAVIYEQNADELSKKNLTRLLGSMFSQSRISSSSSSLADTSKAK